MAARADVNPAASAVTSSHAAGQHAKNEKWHLNIVTEVLQRFYMAGTRPRSSPWRVDAQRLARFMPKLHLATAGHKDFANHFSHPKIIHVFVDTRWVTRLDWMLVPPLAADR